MPELSRFSVSSFVCIWKWAYSTTDHIFTLTTEMTWQFTAWNTIEILAGQLPKRQQRLVEAWAELHQAELEADWQRLQAGQPPEPIAPLM